MLVETVNFRAEAPTASGPIARINGVALNAAHEALGAEDLRQRACTELLRQAAQKAGLLAATDPAAGDGVISEAASSAIDALLERELQLPEPALEACQRHFAAHPARYQTGERVRVRHILFAVTPGMDVVKLRNRAEACLLDVRCHDGKTPVDGSDGFGKSAGELSNCPSGAQGGDLGWLRPPTALPNSRASCSAMSKWVCCRAWCTAASACTWWRCCSASPAPRSPSRPCTAPWPWRCASKPM